MPKHSRQSRSSKTNGRGSSKQLSKKKNSSKRRKTVESDDENSHVNNFFEILQQSTANSVSIKLAIQEWKETINEVDNTKPMAELINFILISSGCQGKISPDIFEERDDINEVLTELQNDSAADLTDYPIISKQKQFTGNGNSRNVNTFIGKLRRFWRDWIKEMQYEIMNVDDNWIFDNLKVWIISMSSSNFRPFRHTSTVIGLSLGIELCAVANSIQSELTIAERQINKEQARKKNGSNSRNRSQREIQLEKKIEELQAKKERLNTHIDDFFVGLFIHRYRDFTDIIRIECANNIRFWIKEYPIYFLNDNYTRYIGWFLSDKSERVRLYALHGFITILSLGEEWMSMFMSFIERFKSRIFEMAKREVNKVVQNLAIVTISEIGKLGLLDEEDYEDIIPLLFLSESKECKHLFNNICANVLNDLVNKNDEEENEEEEEMDKIEDDNEDYQQKQKFKNMKKLKKLIQLLVKYGELAGNEISYCNKVVLFNKSNNETISSLYDEVNDWFNDSLKEKINEFSYESYENAINILWDISDVVKDYNSGLQYLSYDLSEEEIKKRDLSLTEEEEICLIWVIRTSIINTINNMKKQNNSNNKKNKDDEDITDLENINRDIMKILPILLNKYNSDFDNRKVDSLLDIIKELNIELYIDLRIPKSFDELFESLNVIYTKTKNTLILDKCASIYSFLIGYSNSKGDINENQDHYDNSSLISINEIGKRHFSTLLNEIFLKQIILSIDTINEMLNEDNLEENAQTFFESLNYGIKRIVCLLKQIDLQIFKDLIPDYYKLFNQAISLSETLLKKKNIILKKIEKINSNDNNDSTIIVDLEGNKDSIEIDSMEIDSVNEKKDKQLIEIEQLIQEIVNISVSGLYLDINWNGIKLEELEKNEALRLIEKKNQEELEDDIENELEKEMEEDEEKERNKENEKDENEKDENEKDKNEKNENGKNENEKNENEKNENEKDENGKDKNENNKHEKDENERDENEKNVNENDKNKNDGNNENNEQNRNDKETIEEKKKEVSIENKENESEIINVDQNKDNSNSEYDSSTRNKSELEIEKDNIKEKIESLIINNQRILNKNNRKYWTWRSRYFAYQKLADIYLLCNSKFDSLITTDYLKIPTLSVQKEMVNVVNECLELVFDILLNKSQEEYIEDNCLSRKDYSKLMIYSIIGYQLSSLITPLQKLVLTGVIGVESASIILQWTEFVNYYVESNDVMEEEEKSTTPDNDINIINNYWVIISQKIIDVILNKYPKTLIENETQNAAKLTKTNSDDQEEIQRATKAATSIIIKVRTVIDKLLEELTRQSILKTYSLFLKYSKEGQSIPTKLFKFIFNAIKSWSNVSTSSAIRKVVLQALVIFLKKSNQIFFTHLPENISEMSEDDKNSIVVKSSSLWSSLSIIAKAYNSFILNNDEKDLYNNMIRKEIIDDFEKKFEEIKIIPSEEKDIWNSYYEYINVLKSGKIIKKKGSYGRKRKYSKTVSRESSAPNSNINSPIVPENPPKRKTLDRNAKKKNSTKKSKYYVSDSDSDTEITEFETDENETEEEKEEQEEEQEQEKDQEEQVEEEEQEAIELTESSESEEEEENDDDDDDNYEKEKEKNSNNSDNNESIEDSDEENEYETKTRTRNTRSRSSSTSRRNANNKRKGSSNRSSRLSKRQKK